MKDRVCDALALAAVCVFYGGLAVAVGGLCLMGWGLCWKGLVLAAIALVAIVMGRVAGDLYDLAKHNPPAQALWAGLRVMAEATICIFLYLAVMPVALLADRVVKGVRTLNLNKL